MPQPRRCAGFQLHVIDRLTFRPYATALTLLQAFMQLYPNDFQYKEPPYEYEYERLPLDLILGDTGVRTALEQGTPILELEKTWQEELEEFDALRRQVFLYD